MERNMTAVSVRLGAVLSVLAAACCLPGCSSIRVNPQYSGERFPAEFEVTSGYVSIAMHDVGQAVPITPEEETAVRESILACLRDNAYGYVFSFSDSLPRPDAEKRKALDALFRDAVRNIETGVPSEAVISSPLLREELSSPADYLLFFGYSGYFISDTVLGLRMTADFLAAIIGRNQSSSKTDSSTLTVLILDNRNKRYVLCDTSEIEAYNADPMAIGTVRAHVGQVLKNMRNASENRDR